MTFTVQLPSGKPLTSYKTGPGPHTGVHLIIVRDDLAYIIHDHPPIGAGGVLRQTVTFPAPGPYRVLVDVYPNIPGGQPNFQLFRTVHVAGAYHPRPLPPFKADQVVDGYHFDMQGHPSLHAIQAQFVHIDVTDPHGRPVQVRALVRRAGARDLLPRRARWTTSTPTSAPRTPPTAGACRGSPPAGSPAASTAPGKLTVGVLVPVGRHLAAVPAAQGARTHPDRAVHAAGVLVNRAPRRLRGRLPPAVVALLSALALSGALAGTRAAAHARVSPAVSVAGELQLYSLAVPTEKDGREHHQDRADGARRASRSTPSPPAPAGTASCARRAQGTTPWSRR